MLLRGFAWVAIAVAGLATVAAVAIVAGGNPCWSAFAFSLTAGGSALGTFLLGVVPSWRRDAKSRQPDDRITLRMTGCAFLVLVAEAVALQVLPQRGE